MVASSIDEQHPQLPTTTTTEPVVADVTIRAEVDEKEKGQSQSQSQEAHVNSTVDTVTNADVEMVKEEPSEKNEKSEKNEEREKQPQTTVISTTTHNLVDEASKLAEPIVVGESNSSTDLNSSSVEKVKGLTIFINFFSTIPISFFANSKNFVRYLFKVI